MFDEALIHRAREKALSELLSELSKLIERYSGPDDPTGKRCVNAAKDRRFECDAMVLGGLTKSMRSAGLWPMPCVPYEGLSFEQVRIRIQGPYPARCGQFGLGERLLVSRNRCGIQEQVMAIVDRLWNTLKGVDFDAVANLDKETNKR